MPIQTTATNSIVALTMAMTIGYDIILLVAKEQCGMIKYRDVIMPGLLSVAAESQRMIRGNRAQNRHRLHRLVAVHNHPPARAALRGPPLLATTHRRAIATTGVLLIKMVHENSYFSIYFAYAMRNDTEGRHINLLFFF